MKSLREPLGALRALLAPLRPPDRLVLIWLHLVPETLPLRGHVGGREGGESSRKATSEREAGRSEERCQREPQNQVSQLVFCFFRLVKLRLIGRGSS